ncbi:hypothetical protein SNAG_0107 [Streptococcus sp. NPS 308]|uniref:hypothetical protein n=1 Tax=Streptococcus sp. NPS 308 TaxID=1902136 RepID=UPI000875C062|nr:hypothetical protein [Streptococcus sp. NPS 308]BAV79041.1 hypothetical protein SNAG_0107 [Streptococcus sp. NPS 308]
MKFEVELLTKNISIVKLDKLLLSSEIICVTSDSQIELGDENIMGDSDKYQCTLEGADFAIDVRQFRGGLVTILLSYEYSKSKLSSAKKFDKFLSKFREFLEKNDLNYSILSNSLSMYFSNRLYPTFQVYESLLRKILVLALSPLENENVIKVIKKETKGKLDPSKIRALQSIEKLQIAELHSLIFEININPVRDLTIHFKDFQNKNEYILKEMINNSLPITIWEKHFTPFTDSEKVDVLKNNYDSIRQYRNDVMHFHMLTYRSYKKIDLLLSNVIKELEELEYSMLEKWDFEATRKLTNDIFSQEFLANLSSLYKTVSETIIPVINELNANNERIKAALTPLKEVINNIEIPKINSELLKPYQDLSSKIRDSYQLKYFDNFDDKDSKNTEDSDEE